jgi:hypothetical protein
VRQRSGERGLAVAAGAAQGRRDADSIALGVQQPALQAIELQGARHEVGRRLRRHHRHAPGPAFVLQDALQGAPVLGDVEVVDMADPARQLGEIDELRSLDGQDGLALLARQPDLAPYHRARQGLRRHHQDEMLKRLGFQRALDLAPPVAPAFEGDQVLPDAEPPDLQVAAELRGERRSVLAGV